MARLVQDSSCWHVGSPRSQASWGRQHLLEGFQSSAPCSSSSLVTGGHGHHTVYPSGHLRAPGSPVCRPGLRLQQPMHHASPSKLSSSLSCSYRPARAPGVSDPRPTMWAPAPQHWAGSGAEPVGESWDSRPLQPCLCLDPGSRGPHITRGQQGSPQRLAAPPLGMWPGPVLTAPSQDPAHRGVRTHTRPSPCPSSKKSLPRLQSPKSMSQTPVWKVPWHLGWESQLSWRPAPSLDPAPAKTSLASPKRGR